jgi:hypothetical protein
MGATSLAGLKVPDARGPPSAGLFLQLVAWCRFLSCVNVLGRQADIDEDVPDKRRGAF